jgi:hypothetical protein
MAKLYNKNSERAFVHSVMVDGVKVDVVIKPGRVTEVPDSVVPALKAALSERQFSDLIAGDEDIAAARASHQAQLNAEQAKTAALAGENAELKGRIEALEKLVPANLRRPRAA